MELRGYYSRLSEITNWQAQEQKECLRWNPKTYALSTALLLQPLENLLAFHQLPNRSWGTPEGALPSPALPKGLPKKV